MYPRQPVPPAVRELASRQAGVLTREQSIRNGFTAAGLRRMVDAEVWRRISPGVFYLESTSPPWLALAWAGVLIGGEHARLGGAAAAHLHQLVDAPGTIDVLTPYGGPHPQVRGPWKFARERPGARASRTVGLLPRLCIEDTVLDLAASAGAREAISWVTTAVQARRTTPQRLMASMDARTLMRHRALLTELIGDVAVGARSPLEIRYLRDVERRHCLPTGQRQAPRRGTECDVWYDDYALLVELDGLRGHVGEGAFRDMRRDNVATLDGLATLRYGARDVFGDPCAVAFQVGTALTRRGWTGPVVRCPKCR